MANYHDIRYNFAIPSDANVGAMTLIKTLTASSDSALSFVNGSSDVVLDSTYKTYIFKFYNIHPATNDVDFEVGFRDGSTAYDATKTDTYFVAYHSEGDATGLTYDGGEDVAQGTGFTPLNHSTGTDNDQGVSGEMWLFSPSSTTYVKHYMSRVNNYHAADYSFDVYKSGYCNVTAAIDAVQFKMGSGNIDAGTIKLYGIA
jgi:hypothetical protein